MNTIKSGKVGLKTLLPLLLVTASITAQEIEEVVVSGSFIPDEREILQKSMLFSTVQKSKGLEMTISLLRLLGLQVLVY